LLSNEFFSSQNTPKSMSVGASPRLHWGSLQRSPIPPSWFQGGRFAEVGEWREGEGRTIQGGGKRGKEGKGELGREGPCDNLLFANESINLSAIILY